MPGLVQSYQDVLNRAKELGVTLTKQGEQSGKLVLEGQATYAYDRDLVWDAIKTHANWQTETQVQIQVKQDTPYGQWKVKSGDTLSKIAQTYFGDMKRYPEIFEANRDILKDPDKIQVGQTLELPPRKKAGVA